MPPRSLMSSLALAAVAATATLVATPQAQAQGLLDFLWGGGQEWGGGKQNVSFDPKYTAGQIIVSFGDRRLYLISKAGQATSYPIAVPREQSRWQGTTSVTDKRINPSWRPTPEMIRENPKLPAWVPGGHRMNPLGVRAMYLGSSTYRIHGTDAPWTIGQAVSKGCIRMLNEDVLDLYPRVPVGMKVTVTWQRFNSQMIAGDDEPAPFNPTPTASPASYKTPGAGVGPIRQRTPSADAEQVVHNDAAAAVDPNANEATLAAAAEKPIDPKPVKKAEVHKKHEATSTAAATPAAQAPASHDPVAIAEKAAAAATKAAEAARAAADAAKKAAEDAKKATSVEYKEPGKSAAL
jgi:lipoprotein-anchoring transpeptidase ErfK/SrfK